MDGFKIEAISIAEEVEKMREFERQQLAKLKAYNAPLPKTPEDARALAIKMAIDKFGHEAIDVLIASDAKGTYMYSRFRLRELLTPKEHKTND